jgi:hypothetical protein
VTLPIASLVKPATLTGQSNGQLDPAILTTIDGQADGPDVRLVKPAARAWTAMCAAAKKAGHVLKASGPFDSYRPYEVQEKIFRARYTTTYLAGRPYRMWNGQRWYQRPGTAAAAVPGTSNHGWALAVDIGVELDGDAGTESIDPATVDWLVDHAHEFGFSAELQSEPWHWRYVTGDRIPVAVLAYDGPIEPPDEEDDEKMLYLLKVEGDPKVWISDLLTRRHVTSDKQLADIRYHAGKRLANGGGVIEVKAADAAFVTDIPLAG